MSYNILSLDNLIDQFAMIPGVGRKSAQRMAFYIINLSFEDAKIFSDAIIDAKKRIKKCKICQNISDTDECSICLSKTRDKSIICVVQDPKDLLAFERTGEYNGLYHVLHGLISPLDGVAPEDLSIKELLLRLSDETVKEVIMATNPTIEGEATAMYISKLIKPLNIKVTRLAYGIPVGGNLEYADDLTLNRALEGRCEI
ncbi:MAG: recombination protein RecR [Oscillospiraceae bacterium]|nr:recombination protein RecR [Oscillospiraceae bacterium]